MAKGFYWQDVTARRVTRRRALAAGATLAASAAFLAACGGGDGDGGGAATPSTTKVDPTKGVRGGKFVIQAFGDSGAGLDPLAVRNNGLHQQIGFTHDGLLELRNDTPEFSGTDLGVRPNLAQAMPEQPDKLTYIYKLRPAKFHNGQTVTAEDVKYSYDRYAFNSPYRVDLPWLDKVEAVDPQTVKITTKQPYADALASMAFRLDLAIHSKAHVEGPDNGKKLVGSGPFLFVDYQSPVMTRYKRNPEYHRQPYPYFDELDLLGAADLEKRIAQFAARQVHMTYRFDQEEAERVQGLRKNAHHWPYVTYNYQFAMRSDKAPFNDKRVRQALSHGIDRAQHSKAITNGTGVPDSPLSIANDYWKTRKPSELAPESAKLWNYDPAAATQLLRAAGVTSPIQGNLLHWDPSVVGQKLVDETVLAAANWRKNGIAEFRTVPQTFAQSTQSFQVGNYEHIFFAPSLASSFSDPRVGNRMVSFFNWPAGGIQAPPTTNLAYINNPDLGRLVEKQLGQFERDERVKTYREMEDILAQEQYIISTVTVLRHYFGDQSVVNMQSPTTAANGALPGVKYYWFAEGKAP